jgi:hypothetical protein
VAVAPGARFRTEDPQRGTLEAWRLQGGGVEIRGRQGLVLRLSREGDHLRLGDGAGIPRGRFRRDGEELVGHDAGGAVVLRLKAGGGRLVASDRDGTTLGFILPAGATDGPPAERLALAAFPGLSAAERALLVVALAE